MKMIKRAVVVLLLLTACGSRTADLPAPQDIFTALQEKTELPEMVDVADEFLEEYVEISAESYESAVFCILAEGMGPDEIVIVRAKDADYADQVQEALEKHLIYKAESAKLYLTEYLPVIQSGKVRRDGLTVSLLVSEQIESIEQVYQELLKR